MLKHETYLPRGSTYETTVCTTRTQTGETDQKKLATITEAGKVYPNSGTDGACITYRTNWDDCRAKDVT